MLLISESINNVEYVDEASHGSKKEDSQLWTIKLRTGEDEGLMEEPGVTLGKAMQRRLGFKYSYLDKLFYFDYLRT
jgi:hypothetical protein